MGEDVMGGIPTPVCMPLVKSEVILSNTGARKAARSKVQTPGGQKPKGRRFWSSTVIFKCA